MADHSLEYSTERVKVLSLLARLAAVIVYTWTLSQATAQIVRAFMP